MQAIRNIAIIAHVDHGKTTLVDRIIQECNLLDQRKEHGDLILDSNDLERERGITILSKNVAAIYKDVKINIIDTPGHADFGGEVERVLKMADGCLLLVDAKEGPMPQTRFVLKKALEMKLKVIVVINKIDKPEARIPYVLDKTLGLFLELGANDTVADFPIVYASAKSGLAGLKPELSKMKDITPIFDAILKYVPAPQVDVGEPLQLLVTSVSRDEFKGRIATGRIYNGVLKAGQEVAHINHEGQIKKVRLTSVMTAVGLEKVESCEAEAGDIVSVAGIPDISIGETIADPVDPRALPVLKIEEPTVKMTFGVNNSPFAGREGEYSTSRQVQERLFKELENDMALRVETQSDGSWVVSGRGELHLAILIERLRREGYEFQVSRPQVIVKEINGQKLVPYETVYIEVPETYSGSVIQKLGARHGELRDMKNEEGISYLEFSIPTRGLFGYRAEFLTDIRGLGLINTSFDEYRLDPGDWRERDQGSLVAHETGTSNLYGLVNVQDRGVLFICPAVEVYKGQVVGQNARTGDINVNVCKTKKLSNMRSKGDGSAEHFNAPRLMDLEDALEYIGDDELVEVTPKSVRIRKRVLDELQEKRRALGLT